MGFAFLFIQANGCEESAASEVAPARSTTGRSMSFNSLQVIVLIHIEPVRSNCIRLCCTEYIYIVLRSHLPSLFQHRKFKRRHFRSFYRYWHYVMTMVIFGDIFILILIFLGSARLYIHWPQTEDNRGGAWKTSDHWRFSSLLLVNNICSQHIMIFNQFLSSFKRHFQFSCLARKRGIILTRIRARAVVYSNTHTYFHEISIWECELKSTSTSGTNWTRKYRMSFGAFKMFPQNVFHVS